MKANIKIRSDDKREETLRNNGIDSFVAKLLVHRGITDPAEAKRFLNPSIDQLHDPGQIRNITKAAERIQSAIEKGEHIGIFGDYDADGVTSTAILLLTLKDLQAKVSYRLPNRLEEGYGMSEVAIQELYDTGCQLIITVDNGISAEKEVAMAKSLGMDVIVTDHHTPGKELPPADAILNLQCPGETYPEHHLAGCGLAFKLSCYLYEMMGFGEEGLKMLDLAAIGTIADVVPLTGENRTIVAEGLKDINHDDYDRIGISVLKSVLNTEDKPIGSIDVAFRIAPALNATGRLYGNGADKALELLISESEEEAREIADELLAINEERKGITADGLEKAEYILDKENLRDDKVLVLLVPDLPEGITGLVAGKLTEKYNRPSIVFGEGKEAFKASARSPEYFHMYKGLEFASQYLLKFGGHKQAAGMSMKKDRNVLDAFRKTINEYADRHVRDEDMIPVIYVDRIVSNEEVDMDLMETICQLEPYGQGNPRPVLKVTDFTTVKKNKNSGDGWKHYTMMGDEKNHLKIFGSSCEAVGFFMSEAYLEIGTPKHMDLYGHLSVNHFMGHTRLQMEILHIEGLHKPKAKASSLKEQLQDNITQINSKVIEI